MKVSGWLSLSAAAVAVLMFAAGPAAAQPPASGTGDSTATKAMKGGERGGRGNMFKIAMELPGITDEQKQKLEAAQKAFQEKMKALKPAGEAAPGEQKRGGAWGSPEGRKLMEDAKSEIGAILTAEQKKEFEAKLPAPREGRPGEKKKENKEEKKTE